MSINTASIILLSISAISSAIVCFGWTFAYFQEEFFLVAADQKKRDYCISWMMVICALTCPPWALWRAWVDSKRAKHGWKVRSICAHNHWPINHEKWRCLKCGNVQHHPQWLKNSHA